jgi:acetolactate synthase I/II/III large subunit
MNPATMLQTNTAKRAVQCLPKARRFSSTPAPAAVSPYRRTTQAQSQTASKRNVSDTAKRSAQAAAAQSHQRPVPSPAFNRHDERLRDVQPLQPFRQPEMDHSFVGMTGGQIFHEMMLRQGVKHICKFFTYNGA